MKDLTGTTLGQYELEELVGRGGMAAVYKAYQSRMRRHVAVKVLPAVLAADPNYLARFEREAQTIARLEHRSILPVYDYGEQENVTYIVMRYVDTGTLADRMKQGEIPYDAILRMTQQVASALDYAHQQGIIHRDLKPDNIFVDVQGDAILGDFGIAQIREGTQELTGSAIVGTPAYMSPEQGQGEKLDGRSDVYALGVILFEMFTGSPPYQAETPMGLVVKHITGTMPNPLDYKPDLPPRVASVILKATSKDRVERHQTTIELANALGEALASHLDTHIAPLRRDFNPEPAPVVEVAEVAEVASPDSGFIEEAPFADFEAEQEHVDGDEPSVTDMFKNVMRKQVISVLETRSQKLDEEREKRASQAEMNVQLETATPTPVLLPEPPPLPPTPTVVVQKQKRSPLVWILSTLGVIFLCLIVFCVGVLAFTDQINQNATEAVVAEIETAIEEAVANGEGGGGNRSKLKTSNDLEPDTEFTYQFFTPRVDMLGTIDIDFESDSDDLVVSLWVKNLDTGEFEAKHDEIQDGKSFRFQPEPDTGYELFVIATNETEGDYELVIDSPAGVAYGFQEWAELEGFVSQENPAFFYYYPYEGDAKTILVAPYRNQDIEIFMSNADTGEEGLVVVNDNGEGEDELFTYAFPSSDTYLIEIKVGNQSSGSFRAWIEDGGE